MLLLFAILILLAVCSTMLSVRFGVPVLILFILLGIIVGDNVLNFFEFNDEVLTKKIADILIIFIIFDGGFRISKKSFHSVAGPAWTLATFGIIVTSLILGYCIHLILKLDFLYSVMIASIISSTDAAAVFMLTKQHPIKPKLAATLNIESAANDPMAILLVLTSIKFLMYGVDSFLLIGLKLLWQFFGGILFGFLVSRLAIFMYDKFTSESRANYNALIIGIVMLAYGLADISRANGIIAVFFLGHWLGNTRFTAKKGVSNFVDSVSTMCNIALFLMLGLLASPVRFIKIWKEALIITFAVIFISRPIAVFLSTMFFKYTTKEKLFLSWGGIKGAMPIVLATYPAAYNIETTGFIFDIIFCIVFLSCLIQGMSLIFVASKFNFIEKKHPASPYIMELHTVAKSPIDMYEIFIEKNTECIEKMLSQLNLDDDILISSII
ncbi:MAG: potassium/proton antiporter, partial [Treponemataceae bacterium]